MIKTLAKQFINTEVWPVLNRIETGTGLNAVAS